MPLTDPDSSWFSRADAAPCVLAIARALNGSVLTAVFEVDFAFRRTELLRQLCGVLDDPCLGLALTAAAQAEDPGLETSFTLDRDPASVGVSALTEREASEHLGRMLSASPPFRSPFGAPTRSPAKIAQLCETMWRASRRGRPDCFARVDPDVLNGWRWLEAGRSDPFRDGFHDGVLFFGVGSCGALLLNSGSD